MTEFAKFFHDASGQQPWPWQSEFAQKEACDDRVLRIPTGFGKTAGTVLTWLFHRVHRADASWPARLVFCLPMRVLVEQTFAVTESWLQKLGLEEQVGVHVLLGGVEAAPWVMEPARPTILIGTQDMLLSRALMRGYSSARGRWPMEFGLLNTDALWVLDEVQLMGVGLATSTQLAAFRAMATTAAIGVRPSKSWWMSATLQAPWLESVDFRGRADQLTSDLVHIPKKERKNDLFAIERELERDASIDDANAIAKAAMQRHEPGTVTLVIVNTVKDAVETVGALTPKPKAKGKPAVEGPEIKLIHSRFRGADREAWARSFLNRGAPVPAQGRIIVATQVVEAGVDISARNLITAVAPWPSLVQRFGRCARYTGEKGKVLVVGAVPEKEQDALPYSRSELTAAAKALKTLGDDAGPKALESFEESLSEEARAELFPYAPEHVIRRKDLDELFDTTPDLNGADLDVGRFVRGGVERDVSVFWREFPDEQRLKNVPFPSRRELCPAPLFGKGGVEEWLKDFDAWLFDYVDDAWVRLRRRPPPGAVVLLRSADGGYSGKGWDPGSRDPVAPISAPVVRSEQRLEAASSGQADDSLSQSEGWQTIGDHGREVGAHARKLASAAGLDTAHARLLDLAGRWHDAGKIHSEFQARLDTSTATQPTDHNWAKAPEKAWARRPQRPGFRHELVSTLQLLEVARSAHPKFSGEAVAPILTNLGLAQPPRAEATSPLHQELRALDENAFDLVAFLVCAHHGKIRLQWSPNTHDAEQPGRIQGVIDGEQVPAVDLALASGDSVRLPAMSVHLDCAQLGLNARYGRSWTERVEQLIERLGPFQLAYLEALLRAADWAGSAAVEGSTR